MARRRERRFKAKPQVLGSFQTVTQHGQESCITGMFKHHSGEVAEPNCVYESAKLAKSAWASHIGSKEPEPEAMAAPNADKENKGQVLSWRPVRLPW